MLTLRWRACCLLVVSLLASAWASRVRDLAPYYHTGAQIHDRAQALASQSKSGGCGNLEIEMGQRSDKAGNGNVSLDVVTVRPKRGGDGGFKAMIVFGEHARELISAESGLHFLEALCSNTSSGLGGASELKLVLNANPLSRAEVEGGNFCLRTNEDRVDLNRNWGEHFDSTKESAETNPGPSSFSEPESRILRDTVTEFRPQLFLTVHSGALLLGTPFGYTNDQPPGPEEDRMLRVLKPISDKYCDCPFGSLAEVINYKAPGNSIDYTFGDLGVPFSFTWEIYANSDLMEYYHWSRKEQKEAQAGKAPGGDPTVGTQKSHLSLADRDPGTLLAWSLDHASDEVAWPRRSGDGAAALLQRSRQRAGSGARRLRGKDPNLGLATDASSNGDCFPQFNPGSESEYNSVVDKWTNAYFDLLTSVSAEVAGGL